MATDHSDRANGIDNADRHAAARAARAVLAADHACDEAAFERPGVSVTLTEERSGRRRFPSRGKRLSVVTFGAGVVVNCDADRADWLRAHFGDLDRDAAFSASTIAQLSQYVEPDGQEIEGPDLKFLCSRADLIEVASPEGVTIDVVDGADVSPLFAYSEFQNALGASPNPLRPTVIATVARRNDEVIGISGASADCDTLWQIGVDVVASARAQGIGKAIVSRLTREILDRGRAPYYSTRVANLPSRALAHAVGYLPAWVEVWAKPRRPETTGNSEQPIAALIPTLTDGVVRLDGHTFDDIEAHVAGEDEEQARRFGWYPAHSTPETVRVAFERWHHEWRTGGARRAFAAREVASGLLVGGCEIRRTSEGIAQLSYWVFPPFRRRGYASRAVRLACSYAFANLEVGRLELYVEPDNAASRGVARRAGFVEEGILRKQTLIGDEWRDMVLLSRLASEQRHTADGSANQTI